MLSQLSVMAVFPADGGCEATRSIRKAQKFKCAEFEKAAKLSLNSSTPIISFRGRHGLVIGARKLYVTQISSAGDDVGAGEARDVGFTEMEVMKIDGIRKEEGLSHGVVESLREGGDSGVGVGRGGKVVLAR